MEPQSEAGEAQTESGPRRKNGHAGAGRACSLPCDHPRIVVENPCDADAAAALAGTDRILVRVPVDADGLCTDQLPGGSAALIHVTPEHQRPLGAVMSHDRRATLLLWAVQAGALILEEDIDGELRYDNMNVPSLMSLDRSERVIMLGGFGISLGPWLDIAYLVLPRWLVPYAVTARRRIDESRGGLEHTVLAEFLESGGYARHLHRLTKSYASRRDGLVAGLQRHFDRKPQVQGQNAGLHLTWFAPRDVVSPASFAALARRHGLDAAALGDDAILLGFGTPAEHHIETGIRRLAEALQGAAIEPPPVSALPAGFPRIVARGAQG